jgi:hypothetical protein
VPEPDGECGGQGDHLKAVLAGGNRVVPVEEFADLLGISHTQWRWTMATEPERWNDLAIPHGRPEGRSGASPKRYEDLGLCVALVVLLVWALYVGLGAVAW